MKEVFGVDWQAFGLIKNPYTLKPLKEGDDISIKHLFVGREPEREIIDTFFASEEGGCIAICGKVGVGKTSLVNYEKVIWKSERPKLLFSSRREIEANVANVTKQGFILHCIASLLQEIQLTDPNLFKGSQPLQRLQSMTDTIIRYNRSIGFSAGVPPISASLGLSGSASLHQPSQITDTALESALTEIIDFIRSNEIDGKRYEGVIVHMNNFDLILDQERGKEKVINFFNEIRDVLQLPFTFFVFIGPTNFFRDVLAMKERVKAIFAQTPIILSPLTKTQLVEAVRARLEAYKSKGVLQPINPIQDEVLSAFYELYQGDIRSIFSAISDLLRNINTPITSPLGTDDAITVLANARLDELKNLRPKQQEILRIFIENEGGFSQTQIAKMVKRQPTNVITDMRGLRDLGVVEVVGREGRELYLDMSLKYLCLRKAREATSKLQDQAKKSIEELEQMQLC